MERNKCLCLKIQDVTNTDIKRTQRQKNHKDISLQLKLLIAKLLIIKKSWCDSLLLNDRPVCALPTRLSFWMKKIHILFQNWAPCAYQAERLPKCFMNHEIMNIIAILLLNNNIISLDNGLHYVVVDGLHSNLLVNRRWLSRLFWCLGPQLWTLRHTSGYISSDRIKSQKLQK